jgi:hypothetical protein
MVESDRDSMRNCSSQGTRVPRPKEREHAHHLSQPAFAGACACVFACLRVCACVCMCVSTCVMYVFVQIDLLACDFVIFCMPRRPAHAKQCLSDIEHETHQGCG